MTVKPNAYIPEDAEGWTCQLSAAAEASVEATADASTTPKGIDA